MSDEEPDRMPWCPNEEGEPCHCFDDAVERGGDPLAEIAQRIGEKVVELPQGAHVMMINKHPGGMEIHGVSFETKEITFPQKGKKPDMAPEGWEKEFGLDDT